MREASKQRGEMDRQQKGSQMSHCYRSNERTLIGVLAFIISLSLLISLLIVTPQQSLASQQPPHKPSSPEEVTKAFYGWYLGANFPTPKRSNMATFRKYITQSFLKRATARDVESVLFIAAQDIDETWATNFTVSPATISGPKATTEVDLNGKEMKQHLHITLRQEGGVWKIDDVKGSD